MISIVSWMDFLGSTYKVCRLEHLRERDKFLENVLSTLLSTVSRFVTHYI